MYYYLFFTQQYLANEGRSQKGEPTYDNEFIRTLTTAVAESTITGNIHVPSCTLKRGISEPKISMEVTFFQLISSS